MPEQEIQSARTAVLESRSGGAAEYAPEAMAQADQALAHLEEELKLQADKSGVFRSYTRVNELAAIAESTAVQANTLAAEGKVRAREEAMQAIAEVKTSLEETRAMLDQAVSGKGTEADLEAMRQDLMSVEQGLPQMEASFQSEAYLDAKEKAEAASATITSIEVALSAAREHQQAAKQPRS